MTLDDVLREVEKLEKESKAIREDIFKICWYMRGGVPIDDAFALGAEDRMLINGIIKDNLETTKKTGMPFF